MRRLIMSATAIAVMTGAVCAENAKSQALSNSPMFGSYNDVTSNPAWSVEHNKFIEIDYNNGGAGASDVGHILGVMPINDAFNVGAYISGSDTDFHPHLILGMELGDMKLGVEAFYEKTTGTKNDSYSKTEDLNTASGDVTIVENTVEAFERVANTGVNVGAILDIADAEVEIVAGFGGTPEKDNSLTTTKTTVTAGGSTNVNESITDALTKTKGAINFIAGGQATLPMDDNELLVGLGIAGDRYETETTTETKVTGSETTTTTTNSEIGSSFGIGINAGYKFNFDKGLSFAIADEFSWNQSKTAQQVGPDTLGGTDNTDWVIEDLKIDEEKQIVLNHMFTLAAEKEFGKSKLFDKHAFRLGVGYEVNTVIDRDTAEVVDEDYGADTKDTDISSSRDKQTTDFTALNGSAGWGFERGRFSFDLFVSNVNFDWKSDAAGIWNLFGFAGATATIDFGKDGSELRRNDSGWDI